MRTQDSRRMKFQSIWKDGNLFMVLISKEIRIEFARNAVKLWKMENGGRHIARIVAKRLIGVENGRTVRSDESGK